ncbi:cell division protein FtsK, partial [Micromonospora arborensis]
MSRLASAYRQAVNSHRAARAHLDTARRALGTAPAAVAPAGADELVARLARLGGALATPTPNATPLTDAPAAVRIGEASTSDGGFPVLVPLGGGHHLALDTDVRDPRVAGLLRALVLRLVATAPPGHVRVAGIDTAAVGATFGPLRPLLDAGVLDPPATGEAEVAALLDAAEQHARTAQH